MSSKNNYINYITKIIYMGETGLICNTPTHIYLTDGFYSAQYILCEIRGEIDSNPSKQNGVRMRFLFCKKCKKAPFKWEYCNCCYNKPIRTMPKHIVWEDFDNLPKEIRNQLRRFSHEN